MTGFFDFLRDMPDYGESPAAIHRMNNRHKLIVAPFAAQIEGARVLDLGAHDGRWAYALAAAGAAQVLGIEARPDLIARYGAFPQTDFKDRVQLQCGDLFTALEALTAQDERGGQGERGERFDIVALYGIFYHVMDHMRLLHLVRRLQPRLILIDSEFITVENAMIQVLMEEVSNPLNAIPDIPGQTRTVVGIPSLRAMGFMAEALNMELHWVEKELILGEEITGMHDYFRTGRKARFTCALIPKA